MRRSRLVARYPAFCCNRETLGPALLDNLGAIAVMPSVTPAEEHAAQPPVLALAGQP